jgi:hypothetical protein
MIKSELMNLDGTLEHIPMKLKTLHLGEGPKQYKVNIIVKAI